MVPLVLLLMMLLVFWVCCLFEPEKRLRPLYFFWSLYGFYLETLLPTLQKHVVCQDPQKERLDASSAPLKAESNSPLLSSLRLEPLQRDHRIPVKQMGKVQLMLQMVVVKRSMG